MAFKATIALPLILNACVGIHATFNAEDDEAYVENALRLDDDVGEESARREGRLFFNTGLDNNTQVNVNVQAVLVTIAYLVGIALLIALIVAIATGGGSASWGNWFDKIMKNQGYVYQPNYNQDYYYPDSSYAAYRAIEEVPQKYGIYDEEDQSF
ncbi:uncharacterized protein LOC122249145 [Penaeus japonicus]|uniref:uncharacterized protein LOC122249145 n=1 Tax=Penaeus japonicus TaxID=27405 RepID=UPI001C70FB51|nr:uncharacterized protein LOC122249145 [Penaeus japonicus]